MPDYKRLFISSMLILFALIIPFMLLPASFAETRVCSQGCDYSTVQSALNASSSSSSSSTQESIIVESGRYNESLVIGKSVFLRGLDTGSGRPVLAPQSGRIILAGYGAILQGFVLAGPSVPDGQSPGVEGCTLEVVLPANIYLNNFAGKRSVCPVDRASWNSSDRISYQYNSRVLRGRLGNYWADYNETDENEDGIGDQPVILNERNIDYYPLMSPVENYRIPEEKQIKAELIAARVNEPFTISLHANPTAGYEWNADYDYVLLKQESAGFETASSDAQLVGVGGSSVFVFLPLKPGKSTIYFVYKRPWENIAADTRVFHVETSA
ncbi:MAG TPA: protease inhibitor I42 family protein [Methanothrix sp.]|nr:protease inhibitor I42 family protein [Methanothrix sp.]